MKTSDKDSFLQHALALEYIKVEDDEAARNLFNEILLREPTYVGSYYHLGKLLERAGEYDKALKIYERGMFEAKRANDTHAYNELMGAKEEIEE
jgi:Tfp pilus assembly protein PilF